nr:carboxypeptidase regulatory-like domain-containing protein [Rhodopirellula sp. JC639]
MQTIAWATLVVAFAGCGSPIGPTSGVIRFDDGTPVTAGSIEFRRRSDEERFASRIGPTGSFAPTDPQGEIGLPPGSYDVVVVQIVMTEDLAKEAHRHGQTVPRRYADYYTSDLKVEIAENQQAPIELVIESQPEH